jgi:DNA-directed RNA polymerase alpha subunit
MEILKTYYGKKLLEYDLPEMNNNLKRIADSLDRINELLDKVCICKPEIKEPPKFNLDILNYPLDQVFPFRVHNSLNKANIKTIMDLLKSTKEDLLMIKGFGFKSLNDVYNFLECNRISLYMNDEQISQITNIILPDGKELS